MDEKPAEAVVTGKNWYAAYTWPNKNQFVYQKLVSMGVEAFRPVMKVPRKGRGGKNIHCTVSLAPGYVFFSCTPEKLEQVRYEHITGIESLLKGAVDEEYVAWLRKQVETGGNDIHQDILRTKQSASLLHKRVHITEGPFAKFGGTVLRENRMHRTATVELEIWGQTVPTEVPLLHLEEIAS